MITIENGSSIINARIHCTNGLTTEFSTLQNIIERESKDYNIYLIESNIDEDRYTFKFIKVDKTVCDNKSTISYDGLTFNTY